MSETLHEPDAMGAWDDTGTTVWLPKSRYPRPSDARTFMSDFDVPWIEVRVLSRWMRWAPDDPERDSDEWWVECEPSEPGAFPVWRCE